MENTNSDIQGGEGMKIVIVGDGKIGSTLAEQLSREGHEVTIIDQNAVPPAMLSSVLCFQRCRPTVTAAAMSCGAQAARLVNCVPRRQ